MKSWPDCVGYLCWILKIKIMTQTTFLSKENTGDLSDVNKMISDYYSKTVITSPNIPVHTVVRRVSRFTLLWGATPEFSPILWKSSCRVWQLTGPHPNKKTQIFLTWHSFYYCLKNKPWQHLFVSSAALGNNTDQEHPKEVDKGRSLEQVEVLIGWVS